MMSSLVTDANRDAAFSRVASSQIAKDIRSLTSQPACAFNAIHCFSIYTNNNFFPEGEVNSGACLDKSHFVFLGLLGGE